MNNELFSGENSSRGEEDLWSGLLRLQPQQIRPAQWKVGTHTRLNALVLHATLTYCIAHPALIAVNNNVCTEFQSPLSA